MLGPCQQHCGHFSGTHASQRPAAPAVLVSRRATTVIPQAATAAYVTQQKGRARLHQQPQAPTQQQPQQKQRRPVGEGRPPAPLTSKPYLVRIAGRTSSIQGAAGAITKRLRTDDLIRVCALDSGSVSKAVLTLTAANYMTAANSGQMLVFQPSLVTNTDEEPSVPKGSMIMYTGKIMAGEVMATNFLLVKARTEQKQLAGAIAARMRQESHTVLECYGAAAVTNAIYALALARSYLKGTQQDLACLISSGRKADAAESAVEGAADGSEAAGAAAGGMVTDTAGAAAAGPASQGPSKYAATCHRLTVLECEPSRPRALLVKANMGMTDRAFAATAAQVVGPDTQTAAAGYEESS